MIFIKFVIIKLFFFGNIMKIVNTSVLAFFLMIVVSFSQAPRNVDSRDFSVLLSAEVSQFPPSITLRWEPNELAIQYRIYRKNVNDFTFGTNPIAILDSLATEFKDTSVHIGVPYEYEVSVLSLGGTGGNAFNFIGFGYILTGIDVPEYDQPGKVLLLIDETMKDALSTEITRLKHDLRAEGWGIVEKYAPRTEKFDGKAVKETKQIILQEYNKDPSNLKSIYIIGRIAVPYSGDLNPDAHPDHKGAWPADIYYGYPNEALWTDFSVNNSAANRPENKNVPGDGKFDQTQIGTSMASMSIGRVDMYGMKAFHGELQNPEVVLLKRYLDKNHSYRNGEMYYTKSGIIDDNFPAHNILEAFASSGWRNFGVLAGRKNVKKADWFTTLGTESHLFAYGCGGGSYTSCGGVGNTNDFATKPANAVFTMLFGSYFGDWDIDNNFLRASLASDPMILTCAWAGRPHWYFHHMSYGYPIGYSALLSHNNSNTYKPNVVYTSQYPNGVIYAIGMRQIHTALMGDPTLKLSPYLVESPTNLSISTAAGDSEGRSILLKWDSPQIDGEHHFNVYRSTSEFGLYKKVNKSPIKENEFSDILTGDEFERFDGEVYYMVRTAAPEINNSGRFYDISRGIVGNIFASSIADANLGKTQITASPNPAKDFSSIHFTLKNNAHTKVDICDMDGNIVINLMNEYLNAGSHNIVWDLRNNLKQNISSGIYFIRVNNGREFNIEKISVIN